MRISRVLFQVLITATVISFPILAVPAHPVKEVVLVLDNSGSMRISDPEFSIRQEVSRFITNLPENARLAIIIFDKYVYLPMPLAAVNSESPGQLNSIFKKINYNGLFTNSSFAMQTAVDELKERGQDNADRSIVLLTDGIIDTGNKIRDMRNTQWMKYKFSSIAKKQGIRIHNIALSDHVDISLLSGLSNDTGGLFVHAQTAGDLSTAFAMTMNSIKNGLPIQAETLLPAKAQKIVADPSSSLDNSNEFIQTAVIETTKNDPISPILKISKVMSQSTIGNRTSLHSFWWVLLSVLLPVPLALVRWFNRSQKQGTKNEPPEAINEKSTLPLAFLVDETGVLANQMYKIKAASMLVGRVKTEQCELVEQLTINQSTIGRRHAIIEYENHCFWLSDLNSTNGTFLNGKQITKKMSLKHGDKIGFHKYELTFKMPSMDGCESTMYSNNQDWDTIYSKRQIATTAETLENFTLLRDFSAKNGTNRVKPHVDTPDDITPILTQHAKKKESAAPALAMFSENVKADEGKAIVKNLKQGLRVVKSNFDTSLRDISVYDDELTQINYQIRT